MVLQDGPRWKGRFIKKGDKVLEKASMYDFSFEEICEDELIYHDNPSGSIIHAKYHEKEQLEKLIKPPEKFNESILDKAQTRPVLRPINFTADWEKEQKRSKGRNRNDDDEYDFDYGNFQKETSTSEEDVKPVAHDESPQQEISPPIEPIQTQQMEQAEPNIGEPTEPVEVPEQSANDVPQAPVEPGMEPANNDVPIDESMEIVGNAINGMGAEDELPPAENISISPEATGTTEQGDPTASAEFIPAETHGGPEVSDPESSPSNEYKQKVVEEANEEQLAQAFEAAKAAGYEEGFKTGEEKAHFNSAQKVEHVFKQVNGIMEQLQNIEQDIMKNAEENFYEIAQAMAETLLRKEFNINTESFFLVLKKAIDETVGGEQFKVKVSPSTFEKLTALGVDEIAKNLVKDENIDDLDFRIESNKTSVDGNVKKVVENILEQNKIKLFKDEGEAS